MTRESLDKAFICGFMHGSYCAAAAKITAVDIANKKIKLDGLLKVSGSLTRLISVPVLQL